MYAKIKELADEAIALQNKDRMDAVLREISVKCADALAEAFCDVMDTGTGVVQMSCSESGEIVARCPGADAYLAAHLEPAPTPADAEPEKAAKPAKKGGAK